jgi:hypothetical protein
LLTIIFRTHGRMSVFPPSVSSAQPKLAFIAPYKSRTIETLILLTCIRAIRPYLNHPQEQTVGIHVNFSHVAATPPGLTITVKGRLDKIEGRKLSFSIEADDGVEKISEGTHDRFII